MRTLLVILLLPSIAGAAWLDGWSYRKEITIDQTKVDAALSNFPVLVSLAADPNVGANAHADGNDVRFTAADGETLLDAEAETWAVADSNATALLWVRVPSVASDANTVFYLYYGNASAAASWNPSGVWDANYIGVWHMDDATTTTVLDSTSHGNDGTKQTAGHPAQAAGKIGLAQHFDPAADGISVPYDSSHALTSAFTIASWVSLDTTHALGRKVFVRWDPDSGVGTLNYLMDVLAFNSRGGAAINSTFRVVEGTTAPSVETWFHLVVSYDGTDLAIYQDGVGEASATHAGSLTAENVPLVIGNWPTSGGALGVDADQNWDGLLDEVRISNIARSAAYLKADYHSTAGSLVTMGTEEEAESGEDPVPPVAATNVSPADGATDVSISPTLSWTFSGDTCDIWFGTSLSVIESESVSTSYQPGPLAYDTIYQWRIDVTDPNGTTTGTVWDFRTVDRPAGAMPETGWQRERQWRTGPPQWRKSPPVWRRKGATP